MWADNETTEDLIGFNVHADLLKSLITEESILPLTIGLFGDWGSGKTSIMRMLAKKFEAENDAICIYFNGWLFEGYDDAKSAILNSIVLQLYQEKKNDSGVKETAQKLIASINWMRVMRMGAKNVGMPLLKAYLTGGLSMVSDIGGNLLGENDVGVSELIDKEKFEKGEFAGIDPMDVRSFREKFSTLIEASKVSKLVILVDDLDRCSPDRLIDNLEAIKLFLNVKNTAFVIGADPRIIRFAISTRYNIPEISDEETEVKSSDLVRDYLEKLIQVPYHLPKLSPSEVETYMVLLFSKKELGSSDYEKILEAYYHKAQNDRYSKFGINDVREVISNDDMSNQYQERLTFVAATAELITEGLKGNPRQVKRFLNAFMLRKKLALAAKLENIKDNVLVKLMILEYVKPSLFKDLFNWQASQNGYPNQIKFLEDNLPDEEAENFDIEDKWKTETIEKWINIDPPLSNIDLRDYFWVARDKLESTLSSLTLVSPIIKNLFQRLISGNDPQIEISAKEVLKLDNEEQIQVFDLLKSKIIKEPENFDNYKPFRHFNDLNIPNTVTYFVDTLEKVAPNKLPVALSIMLREIAQSASGDEKEQIDEFTDGLKNSETKIAKVINKK